MTSLNTVNSAVTVNTVSQARPASARPASGSATMSQLDAQILGTVDFDWTMHLSSVWNDHPFDVADLHANLRGEITQRLESLQKSGDTNSPLGWFLVGSGGSGKTHLLSHVRREAMSRRVGFVMVDMTDVRDFWETVAAGYLNSLQQPVDDDRFQFQVLLENFIALLNPSSSAARVMQQLASANSEQMAGILQKVLKVLRQKQPSLALKYQDVVRAVVALNSDDFDIASAGITWLQGVELDESERNLLGFRKAQEKPLKIVEGLSWLMSLSGPSVLAFDQLDPIVTQLDLSSRSRPEEGTPEDEETATARSIIEQIGGGLGALRDVTSRTLTLVSCLETTVNVLREFALKQDLDRFEEPRTLGSVPPGEVAQAIVASRLQSTWQEIGFEPLFATWPFASKAFETLAGLSPRQILKHCHRHQRNCLAADSVSILTSFGADSATTKTASTKTASTKTASTKTPPAAALDSTVTASSQTVQIEAADGTDPAVGQTQASPGKDSRGLVFERLTSQFEKYRRDVDPAWLVEDKSEAERIGALLQSAMRLLIREAELPDEIDAVVDVEFGSGASRGLDARLRQIDVEAGRELHFCVRALERRHATAFQARLKAALTESGIDPTLRFRRLTVFRSAPIPGGPKTATLTQKFESSGGVMLAIPEDELRTLAALRKLEADRDPNLTDWLQRERPVSRLLVMQQAVPELCGKSANASVPSEEASPADAPPADAASSAASNLQTAPAETAGQEPPCQQVAAPPAAESKPATAPKPLTAPDTTTVTPCSEPLPLGRRVIAGRSGEVLSMPVAGLEKHSVVLAGAGSGKTVLLKRLIEEAALRGIPSIVIDGANDLAALGDRWSNAPEGWNEGDDLLARQYHDSTEVVVWTPGRESGNPLTLKPLPDLAAITDPEEREAAIDMAAEALRPIVATGTSAAAKNKQGLLRSALRFFARQSGGSLMDFAGLLSELPAEAGLQINKEDKLARDMADSLRAEVATNPLLRSTGTGLDPAILFGDIPESTRTRVSVISLMGLPGLPAKQQFLNQLAMTLFTWIKQHPNSGRDLRGLLVIDEAKDFVPSRGDSVCRAGIMRLAAQARKYHLGMVFATQNPREIENTIIGNCSTHFYGKANSSTAIAVIREQIALRGGAGQDVPTLKRGQFYAYNADLGLQAPAKLQVPMCLSAHPKNPLTEETILQLARDSAQ
jgi:hypothetical protein